jgi:uncharacterized membrane protein
MAPMVRDLTKTITFAALHFAVGFGVSYAFTGSVAIATGIALVEPALNTVVFFFHERAWRRWPALQPFAQATIFRKTSAMPSGGR